MSIKIKEFIEAIEQIAPPALAETWDNQGLQISPASGEISHILLALELTPDVISEARDEGVDMIVTHHPLFFAPVKSLDASDPTSAYALRLLRGESIGLYSAHTSFDAAQGGLNDELLDRLGIVHIPPEEALDRVRLPNYSRIGKFTGGEALTLLDAVDRVKSGLNISEQLRYRGDHAARIDKVMTCSGGGGDLITIAKDMGADLFITGDIRQHEWRLAEALDIALIDAGHYWTERIFSECIHRHLSKLKSVKLSVSKRIAPPYSLL